MKLDHHHWAASVDFAGEAGQYRGGRRVPTTRALKELGLTYRPSETRYDAMIYNQCGRSGLRLSVI
ncbi:MAG: hypothetical protein ABR863_05785 [Roseiarcus sp.]